MNPGTRERQRCNFSFFLREGAGLTIGHREEELKLDPKPVSRDFEFQCFETLHRATVLNLIMVCSMRLSPFSSARRIFPEGYHALLVRFHCSVASHIWRPIMLRSPSICPVQLSISASESCTVSAGSVA